MITNSACILLTLAPLLGPIGGGLGLVAVSPAGEAAEGAAASAVSSDALTTSLELAILLDFIGNINMLVLEESDDVVLLAATLRDKTNPQAADAMLLLAMDNYRFVCVSLSGNVKSWEKGELEIEMRRGFE